MNRWPSSVPQERLWLAGQWRSGHATPKLLVHPGDEQAFGRVAQASELDLQEAARAASAAHRQHRWTALPSLARGQVLNRMAQLIRQQADALCAAIVAEQGMPEGLARYVEIPMAASVFEYYAGLCSRPTGTLEPFNLPGAPNQYLVLSTRQPIGVAGLITPWNFPLLMPSWKLAAAWAAGCPTILKPAPETPLSALLLASLSAQAELPEGMLSVLPGDDALGEAIVRHPDIPKISLTGGLETGRAVMRLAGPLLKRVSLELGGKSPLIIFADADLDQAVSAALFGVFLNAGQVCQASSRLLVERPILETFNEKLVARAATLKVGSGFDENSDLGPIISRQRLADIDQKVTGAVQGGARLLLGGQPLPGPGFFYPPTILDHVQPKMPIAREEVFGPVCTILPFEGDEQAVALANDSCYGLTAALWTPDLKRSLRLASEIDAGTIWLNAVQVLTPNAPFGGLKWSGLGRDLGHEGVAQYEEHKTIIVDLNDWPMAYF